MARLATVEENFGNSPKSRNKILDTGTGKYIQPPPGIQIAPVWDGKTKIPEGYAAITIELGSTASELSPVFSTVDTHRIMILRNSKRLVPISHVYALMDCVETRYTQAEIGMPMIERQVRRFHITVHKIEKSAGMDLKGRLEASQKDINAIEIM